MALDLEPIKARLSAATPGPWKRYYAGIDLDGEEMWYVGHNGGTVTIDGVAGDIPYTPDAEFIAHAPSDIAALVAEVERLRKVAEAAAEAIDAKTERDGLSYYGAKPEGWGDKMDANTARSRSAYVLLVAAVREWREAGE
jgi:hypothetical protein